MAAASEAPSKATRNRRKGPDSVGSIRIDSPAKSAADLIGYEEMFEDGICKVEENLYSIMLEFEDVSYQDRRYEEQMELFGCYKEFLHSLDSATDCQILISNRLMDADEVRRTMFLEMVDSEAEARNNAYRAEINQIIETKVAFTSQSVERDRYLVITTAAPSKDEAKAQLLRDGEAAIRKFEDIGSAMRFLSGPERLAVMASILRPSDAYEASDFDYAELAQAPGMTTKHLIEPWCIDHADGHVMKLGGWYGCVMACTKYSRTVKDDTLSAFCELPMNLIVTEHISTMESAEALDYVDTQLTHMKAEKTHEMAQKSQKFFYTEDMLPPALKDGITNAEELHSDIATGSENFFFQTLLIYAYAESMEELERSIEAIQRVARMYQLKVDPLNGMQRSVGLRSVLPNGKNSVPIRRMMTSSPLAAFMPFVSEDLMQMGGAYNGENQLTKNPIFLRRASLDAPNGFIVGKPGRGKSFSAKQEIENTYLSDLKATIDVVDPEREFTALAKGHDDFEVVHISEGSGNHINPFDLNDDYSDDDDPLAVKVDFIMSLVREMAGGTLKPAQESIIDRVCQIIYQPYFDTHKEKDIPILSDFAQELKAQPEPEAKDLSTIIERYVTGTMSVFNHRTNIDTSKRGRIWDIKDLGKSMRTVGLLVVLDQIWYQITRNREAGIRSYFYTDEWQLLLKNPYAIDFYDELWSRSRKWGAVPTAITQNIARVLQNEKARLMLANSDYLMLLGQSPTDAAALRELLHLSDAQMRHITSKRKGAGLLVAGSKCIPFVNEFPDRLGGKPCELYKMFTTKFDDLVELGVYSEKEVG